MKDSQVIYQDDANFDLKEVLLKYLNYWPWFLITVFLFVLFGAFYIYVTPNSYMSEAKIKILDEDKQMEMSFDFKSLMRGSSVNLDNEIAVLTSYRLLNQVVAELNLDIDIRKQEGLKKLKVVNPPFKIEKLISENSLYEPKSFEITMLDTSFRIFDENSEKVFEVPYSQTDFSGYPFKIKLIDTVNVSSYEDQLYDLLLVSKKSATQWLKSGLKVESTTLDSQILKLNLSGQRPILTEDILNTIIKKFDEDGILDRQLVNKRTIDFIDNRFEFLISELDSIELKKQDYKRESNLSYIQSDAQVTIEKLEVTNDRVFQLETQVALVKMLSEALTSETAYTLLPANMGIESDAINELVSEYNSAILEREKIIGAGAGVENPQVRVLTSQMESIRVNILKSIDVFEEQLDEKLSQLKSLQVRSNSDFSQLPQKERMLREIERQQNLKEALYLLLLQKREEAAISYAVTSPSIKIVDYAITGITPVAPRKRIILIGVLFLGIAIPFGILYLRFLLDNKIHGKVDLEKEVPEVPVLAELPFVEGQEILNAGDSRSSLAEAFRILSTNVEYLLPKEEEGSGRVVFVTSTKKGEGKTFVALNLSLALASLNKKVLLVGSDLRNPQLHKYFEKDKNFSKGLSGYLFDTDMQFKDCWEEGFTDFPTHKICFSGVIPPNAPQLLASKRYGQFLEEARKEFDYVIVDTAPTILVTDTLMISKYADETVYVTRADYTEKEILNFAKELHDHDKLNNMAFVVNAVGKSAKGYGYKYGYGYSYGYGYGYNYGYGYGYGSDEDTSAKKKKKGLFKRFRK